MEQYWDCSLCRVENKGRAPRCRHCSGKLKGRDRLAWEAAASDRVARRASMLSAVAAGLGQVYARRWTTGLLFAILLPLAIGLVAVTWNGFNYGHAFLAAAAVFVLAVAAADARLGPRDRVPPCQDACPARVPIPDYLQLLQDGEFDAGYHLVRTRVPLVGTIGRICPHPCETRCLRGIDGEPIAINGCKRFLADVERARRQAAHGAGRRAVIRLDAGADTVAVVGGGPAGLACAYYLAVLGVPVTVYEASDRPGGRLADTIPDYRLPAAVLREEIGELAERGVSFATGTPVGPGGRPVARLLSDHGAVFLATGAAVSVELDVPGAEAILDFQAFLRAAKSGSPRRPGRRVAVIGGGNAAVDVCRTALRLGAEQVHLLYRREREQMPARRDEVEEAEREGVRIHYLASPAAIQVKDGRVEGVEVQRMRLGADDASGRPRPEPVEGDTWVLPVDAVIPALGQRVDGPLFQDPALAGLERTGDGRIRVAPDSQRTNLDRVYAGGDVVTGPATAVRAMADGRRAALAIYAARAGTGGPAPRYRDRRVRKPFRGHRETPQARIREEMPKLGLRLRRESLQEVEEGFREPAACREAGRCLQCHREL